MADRGFESFSEESLSECKQELDKGGVKSYLELLNKKLDEWKTVPLNIAVIGRSGVGKSSFINAIRNLTAEDGRAVKVGPNETTLVITSHPYPTNGMMKFWDLPGVGTAKFPKETYLQDVHIERYDFFVLLSATRFYEDDAWLGNEIVKLGKQFFYVRTKIGDDIRSNSMAYPKKHKENAVLFENTVLCDIRKATSKQLEDFGCKNTKIFLIDNYEKNEYDFHKLEQSLVHDFPELKRSALILSLSALSEGMVKIKADELRKRIWMTAGISATVALIPIPGVSLMFDAAAVLKMARYYFQQLGLDDESLEEHARMTSIELDTLKEIVNAEFNAEFFTIQGIKLLVNSVAGAAVLAATFAEEFTRFIPIIGSFIAAPLSYGGTYTVHKILIDKMETVAMQVVKYAAVHNRSNSIDDD